MSLKAKIEAVIYTSEEPITLAQLAGLLGEEAQAELDALNTQQLELSESSDDADALNAEVMDTSEVSDPPTTDAVILSEGGAAAESKDPEGASSASTPNPFSKTVLPNPCSLIPNPCRVAVIGPATARALEAIGLKPHLIPPQAVAESLAAALLPHALQPDGSPTRFLLVRAEQARDVLPETLTASGAEVTIASAYRTVIPLESIPAIRDLFAEHANYPDAITFTSSSTATNLLALLESAGLTLPPEILRISIGPITSQTLRDLDLPPHAEAAQPTIPALVEKVVKTLKEANLS